MEVGRVTHQHGKVLSQFTTRRKPSHKNRKSPLSIQARCPASARKNWVTWRNQRPRTRPRDSYSNTIRTRITAMPWVPRRAQNPARTLHIKSRGSTLSQRLTTCRTTSPSERPCWKPSADLTVWPTRGCAGRSAGMTQLIRSMRNVARGIMRRQSAAGICVSGGRTSSPYGWHSWSARVGSWGAGWPRPVPKASAARAARNSDGCWLVLL